MPEGMTAGATALVLRDVEGNLYVLDEKTILACRATPEQQVALTGALPDQQDVSGFVFTGPIGLAAQGGLFGQLFFVTQAESRDTGGRGADNFVGPVTATGVFSADIGRPGR